MPPPGKYMLDGVRYASRPEAACGSLMQRFIPGFKVIDGKSFQVPIGKSQYGHVRTVDFKIGSIFLEYHHPRHWTGKHNLGDFKDREEVRFFKERLANPGLNPEKRERIRAQMYERLKENYTAKRRGQLDTNPETAGAELIVATTPEEFYDLVLKRFAPMLIPEKDFCLRLFKKEMKRAVAVDNKEKRRQKAKKRRIQSRKKRQDYKKSA